MPYELSRRSLLRLAGGAALAASSGSLLTACGSGTTGQNVEENAKVRLPKYIRYEGVLPDLPPVPEGVMPGFLRYPAERVTAVPETPGSGEELTAFVAQYAPVPPPVGRNEFWQNLNEQLGVTMNLQMVPGADWADKLSTKLAGDDLADFMMLTTANVTRLPDLLAAKFQDLTEFVSDEAIEAYPLLANLRPEQWRPTVFNGGIYGIPIPRDAVGPLLFTRMDILREKDLNSAPSSFAEFKELAEALTDAANEKWAFADPLWIQDYVQRMLGSPHNWQVEDGKFTPERELETTKQALSDTRDLLEAGYFHPDWSSDAPPTKDWLGAGTVAMNWDNYSAWPGYISVYKTQHPEMELDGMLPPAYDSGSTPNLGRGAPIYSITALKKSDDKERIELLLRVANSLAAPFGTKEYLVNRYGVEGVHYDFNEDGDPVRNDKGTVEGSMGFPYIADAPLPLYEPGRPEETEREHAYQVKAVPMTMADPSFGLYSETANAKGPSLNEMIRTARIEILQGRQPVSYLDDLNKQWRQDGGDKIIAEFEEAYAAQGEIDG